MSVPPLLSVRGLAAKRGWRPVVAGADLHVFPGDRVYIQGENGCGKTTFLEALLGLIPSEATHQEWLGLKGTPCQHRAFRNGSCVYVPQFRNLFSSISLRANILLGSPLETHERFARLNVLCEHLPELGRILDKSPRYASGGERQLAAVLRALMHRPRLLLLDEPTAGVSPAAAARVYELLWRFLPAGCAIVYTDHNGSIGEKLASRWFALQAGTLLSYCHTEDSSGLSDLIVPEAKSADEVGP